MIAKPQVVRLVGQQVLDVAPQSIVFFVHLDEYREPRSSVAPPRPARDRRSRRVPRSWRFRLYTIEYQDCDRFLRPLIDEEAPQKNRSVGARESLPGAISTAGELVRSGPRDGNGRDTGS